MTYSILTLCGSLRAGSLNRKLLEQIEALAPDKFQFSAFDRLGELPLYNQDIEDRGMPEIVSELADQIRTAKGVLIASPEYNYSVTPALKNAIDWVSRVDDQPFAHKPVSIMSVSPSPMGGIRGQLALRQVFIALKAPLVQRPEVAIGDAHNKFDEAGKIDDETTRGYIEDHLKSFGSLMDRY